MHVFIEPYPIYEFFFGRDLEDAADHVDGKRSCIAKLVPCTVRIPKNF